MAVAAAIILAVFVSVKFGQIAGIAAAAVAGNAATSGRHRDKIVWARGLLPALVVLLGGIAFVGYVELEPPQTGLLLLPLAPLMLWTCVWGPLARLTGMAAAATQTAVVSTVILVALVLLM